MKKKGRPTEEVVKVNISLFFDRTKNMTEEVVKKMVLKRIQEALINDTIFTFSDVTTYKRQELEE